VSSQSSTPSDASAPGDAGAADLDEAALRAALVVPGGLWTALDVTGETGSTNNDLLAAAKAGAAHGTVLAARQQTRGRGRQGREWVSPPGAALAFSVLLRPAGVPASLRGWLPLLAGVATARGVRAVSGSDVTLKWPNDVLAGEGKLAGILAEQAGDAIVTGIGINVTGAPAGLPGALPPVSLAAWAPAVPGRDALLTAILGELATLYGAWAAAGGDPDRSDLRAEYLRWCGTVGRPVQVQLPGAAELAGTATGIDGLGRLLVDDGTQPVPVTAGDVIHVR
jgi:BirA family biotin operon repressor/biotin-[acetyl-CoA-carboxylase] ligase